MKDWLAWHQVYDDTTSSLSRRVRVVAERLEQVLRDEPPARCVLLSLCAGDGRDVIPCWPPEPRRHR